MFFLKKKKPEITRIGPAIGASLVKQSQFPASHAEPVKPAVMCTLRGTTGAPPDVTFVDEYMPGQNKAAFLLEGTANQPPLAIVNVEYHIEVWETSGGTVPKFERKRAVQFDAKQDEWVIFGVMEVACLPGGRLLLAIEHHSPIKRALYVYDPVSNACTKLSDVTSLGITPEKRFQSADTFVDSQFKLFDALFASPDEVLVLFYTGEIRLAAEVYYNTPGRIYAFTPQHPEGVDVMQLSADDGVVDSWMVQAKTLWLATQDFRDRKHTKSYVFSLDLQKLLAR